MSDDTWTTGKRFPKIEPAIGLEIERLRSENNTLRRQLEVTLTALGKIERGKREDVGYCDGDCGKIAEKAIKDIDSLNKNSKIEP